VTFVETRVSVWEALAGRAPGSPGGPADPGLWAAVVERLNPARARPVLRAGIECAELVSVRGVPYVMLRSPDDQGRTCYLRLAPEEWRLAQLMDGSLTVARLVAEFARLAGRLAPDQVRRVVADLAANRMLDELPVDAFSPLDRVQRRPWPVRLGRNLLAAARGQRMVVADVDPLISRLYRAGGRLLFTPVVAALLGAVAVAGLGLFVWTWWRGSQSVFLTGGSYAAGAAVLLGLNVVALACHELGHALATKHAGRRVPAAGFLVYFGIPSVYVDTTDVWMAGRRARMVTTAAGPAAGLVLAGLAQLVGLLVPETGPWVFKLAFAWYLNALFNLNPFLALDGYYLLMDWLEIPNLRARGLSWVLARLRRRPPAWSALDREGRLVALYGTIAVLWLVIAVNLGYRIWSDRVSGLATGLWRGGWPARLLLVAVVAGLAAPLVYLVVGWTVRRVRRIRQRLVERRAAADVPRRLGVLRGSALGGLSEAALTALATRARWMHPTGGQQVVFAGAAQPAVYVVADGALQGRRHGDPGGTIRRHAGPGAVVGLANALTGAPAALDWHTAGTTLLALPPAAVSTVVGPLPGPPPADRADAEALFAQTPALAGLATEDRLALIAAARPVALGPGDPVVLAGPTEAVVVESGVIVLDDGTQFRRGTLVGPVGEGNPGAVASARTPVRLWSLPDASSLPPLVGAVRGPGGDTPAPVRGAPTAGAHPTDYPPLAAPPGPPPEGVDDEVDRRFERRMWWLVLLLVFLALLIVASNLLPGPAWAEMPADRALLTAEQGRVTAVVDGRPVSLARGGRLYVGEGARVEVHDRSTGRLTFRGGAATLLCAGTRVDVGRLWSDGSGNRSPHGRVVLGQGRVLADTASTSGAFAPLALALDRPVGRVTNDGSAWYAVDGGQVQVSTGDVRVDGAPQAPTGGALTCGDGVPVIPPAGTPSQPSSPSEVPTATLTPSATPSPTPRVTASTAAPVTPTTPARPQQTPPRPPTTGPSRTGAPSPLPTRSPSPSPSPSPIDTTPPVITRVSASPTTIYQIDCATTSTVTALVREATDVAMSWTVTAGGSVVDSGSAAMTPGSGNTYTGSVGPFSADYNVMQVALTVTAIDAVGNAASASPSTILVYYTCDIIE
jgi:putative peptide zinc metalloprotease protein